MKKSEQLEDLTRSTFECLLLGQVSLGPLLLIWRGVAYERGRTIPAQLSQYLQCELALLNEENDLI